MEEYEGSRTEFMKMLAEHDSPPAYIVRAQRVEAVWLALLESCRQDREELLELPRMRLAQVAALVNHRWESLNAYLDDLDVKYLCELHDEWQPTLRAQLAPSTAPRRIRSALSDLRASFTRCNRRWDKYVTGVNLNQVNYERDQYNDYYLVEKSAALGSDRLAEMGFERLDHCVADDIFAEIPLLREFETRG